MRRTDAGVQTIIKMKDVDVDVRSPQTLRALSERAGVVVEYVRPMSGDAHLVLIRASSAAEYEAALARLRGAAAVQYVERDEIMRTN